MGVLEGPAQNTVAQQFCKNNWVLEGPAQNTVAWGVIGVTYFPPPRILGVLWKRLNTEMPQKKSGNPSKTGFLRRFRNFCKKNGNPSKPSF